MLSTSIVCYYIFQLKQLGTAFQRWHAFFTAMRHFVSQHKSYELALLLLCKSWSQIPMYILPTYPCFTLSWAFVSIKTASLSHELCHVTLSHREDTGFRSCNEVSRASCLVSIHPNQQHLVFTAPQCKMGWKVHQWLHHSSENSGICELLQRSRP